MKIAIEVLTYLYLHGISVFLRPGQHVMRSHLVSFFSNTELKCTSLQRPGLLIWFYLSPVCFARASVDPLHVVLALYQFWCNIELLQTIAWMYVISNFV